MKILMSALACEPGNGSELEVGFRTVLAAAGAHEVWLLTNKDSIPALRRALDDRPEGDRIHLEGIDFGVDALGLALLTIPGFHFYYDRWQRRAAARALELDREVDFDVVHHVTLAAYWTRTGVAVLDKPLVWGPVGGGVEPPLRLLGELSWRGLFEDAGRVLTRRLLGRLGPARLAQQRAVVTFAQNTATLKKIHTPGRISVLTNATAIDLGNLRFSGTRTREVFVVGRLIAWKAPMLALRAFRYVRNADATLVFCGEGPERHRLSRAARRWGIAHRIRFEGWLRREMLLARLASAGALLHPALHEEAGLCVAEALALGTPAVCLDHGGPTEILRQWPRTASASIPVGAREVTAKHLAAAIDRLLDDSPPISAPQPSMTSYEQELLSAYQTAVSVRRGILDEVWAFPRGKPQLFANSPRELAKGVLVYAFGRRIPRLMQRGISLQMRVPGLRRLLIERMAPVEPVCGADVWRGIVRIVRHRHPTLSGEWLHFSSQWEKQRSSFVGLNTSGEAEVFLTIEPRETVSRGASVAAASYRVPACRHAFATNGWSVREFEPLPRFHRPARWDSIRIRQVAADVSRSLAGRFQRPAEVPGHWLPMHGDLVPWNLREDERGQLWLLDWEDVGWGPPLADLFRFVIAFYSLKWSNPGRIASCVRTVFALDAQEALQEVTGFWLGHRNFQQSPSMPHWPRQKRELAALCLLAEQAEASGVPAEPVAHRPGELQDDSGSR